MPRTHTRTRTPNFACSVVAREGGGKTEFGLSAPKPIACINMDPNTDAILDKLVEAERINRGDVELFPVTMPSVAFSDADDVKREAESAWEQQVIDPLRVIINGNRAGFRTVMFDTGTELDSLNILAEFGKTDQIAPDSRRNRMGPVNRRFKGIIEALTKTAGVNVVLLHRARDKYETKTVRSSRGGTEEVNRKLEGGFDLERIGFKDLGYVTSAEVFLQFDHRRDGKLRDKFGLYINRASLRPAIIGREYWGQEELGEGKAAELVRCCSFPFLATLIYPQTELEDWL